VCTRQIGILVIMSCAALVAVSRPATAGFQCGPGGKPKLGEPVGCDCPAGKLSRRVGEHWTCVAAPPRHKPAPPPPPRDDAPPVTTPALEVPSDADKASAPSSATSSVAETPATADPDPAHGEHREPGVAPDRSPRVVAPPGGTDGAEPIAPARSPAPGDGAVGLAGGDTPSLQPPIAIAPEPAHEGQPSRGYAIATGVAGVVVLGVGTGFAWYGKSLSGDASRTGAMFDEDRDANGKLSNIIAIAGLASGAALVAVGATLYFKATPAPAQTAHARRGSAGRRLAVTPTASPDAIGLAVTGLLP
jgi:hypothetical protein